MDQSRMVKLVESQLVAYNARDIEAFTACFHNEVEFGLLGVSEHKKGIVAFKKTYGALFAVSPKLHAEIKKRTVLAESVLDEEWVTGNPKSPNGAHVVAIYHFKDDKISRIWFAR